MVDRFTKNRKDLKEKQFSSLFAGVILAWVIAAVLIAVYISGRIGHDRLDVEDKINPNTAAIESLVRLPGVGPATAVSIIEYRKQSGEKKVFFKPSDLQGVKGIGPKTVEKIEPLLTFE